MSKLELNAENFFKYFMFNPDSKELSPTDQKIALAATIVTGIFSLGIIHLVCRAFFYDRTIVQIQPSDTPKITTIAEQRLNIKSYDEEALEALDRPCEFKDLTERYRHHSKSKDLKRQFELLGQTYYFQRARGGGNCFYLAYASGVLHHLLNNMAFHNAAILLEAKKDLPGKQESIALLKELEKSPTVEKLYQCLTNELRMQPFIDFLRAYALDEIRNGIDEERTRVTGSTQMAWDNDALFPVIDDSQDVQAAIDNQKQMDANIDDKEAYCRYQEQNGTDIQRPEIGVLHQKLWPIAICLRLDDPLLNEAQKQSANGFLADYPLSTSFVQVFRTGNHFDALIPKGAARLK